MWHFDYEEANRLARANDRDVLIFYKDPLDPQSGVMRDILESPHIEARIGNRVKCTLVPFYEPNVRFMAQFGIQQAPAIVVVHPDTTYHALAGVRSAEEVSAFLDSATGPGSRLIVDPQIPRSESIEFFNTFERARDKALRQNRRLVIVYKWWLDAKSSDLIRRLTSQHVSRYLADSVNCILDWDYVPNRNHVAAYGVQGFPAVIIVEPHGAFRTLVGQHSDESVIRFIASPTRPAAAFGQLDDSIDDQ